MSYVARRRSLRRADQPTRGVLPSVVCLGVVEETHRGGLGPIGLSSLEKKRYSYRDDLCSVMVTLPLLQEVNYVTIPLFF